ncbi:MAG TPA: energy-coupling factor transporter transmembrane component T, partial [Miltoncostaeaceae bacterium]|nr:energy-coupling factor transporter transmembrane component T [Miltoncostaeaceae bacterium]
LAFLTDAPPVLAALLAGGWALWRAAPVRNRLAPAVALLSGAGLLVITPLVAAQGDLILLGGPRVPILDLEVTLEEVVAGAVSATRLAAVVLLTAGALALVDPDRLQALAARLAPRSALVAGLAARLLPTLQRDAAALSEGARLRGARLTVGARRERLRAAAPLVVPLVGSSLERSLDLAEAMAARGYGSGPRTRMAAPPRAAGDAVLWAAAAVLALGGAAAWTAGALAFDPYPRLPSPFGAAPLAAALLVAAALTAAAGAARR